jgi:hypothetical protein
MPISRQLFVHALTNLVEMVGSLSAGKLVETSLLAPEDRMAVRKDLHVSGASSLLVTFSTSSSLFPPTLRTTDDCIREEQRLSVYDAKGIRSSL